MYSIEINGIRMTIELTSRGLNYGRLDVTESVFHLKLDLSQFLKNSKDVINEFIKECMIDDKNQVEPDIPFLQKLSYPLVEEMVIKYPTYFCDLLYDYPHLIYKSLFYNNDFHSGFVINNLDKIYIEEDVILLEGRGYFFPIDKS